MGGYTAEMSAPREESRFTGTIFIVLTLVGWASVLLFLKHLTPYIDAWSANGWRYGLSALLWLPILVRGSIRSSLPDRLWRRAICPAIFNCIGQICFALIPYYIGPGLGAFLLRVNIIFSTAGALILFADERVLVKSPKFWIGMVLVCGGSAGTMLLGGAPITGAAATGVILGLLSGAFYGFYGVSVRYFMHGVPAMTSFAVISLYTAIGMIALMIVYGNRGGLVVLDLSAFNWLMLVASALVGIALGHVFYYAAIARLGVAISAAVVQLAPFLCAAASTLIFNEILTRGQWLCGVIMLFGAATLIAAEKIRKRPLTDRAPPFPVELEDAGSPTATSSA